uniref:Uncharacterized protein n=1 Tax=Oryza brachyantha TaxID=4533 RepID=J3LPB0_ORYBR
MYPRCVAVGRFATVAGPALSRPIIFHLFSFVFITAYLPICYSFFHVVFITTSFKSTRVTQISASAPDMDMIRQTLLWAFQHLQFLLFCFCIMMSRVGNANGLVSDLQMD